MAKKKKKSNGRVVKGFKELVIPEQFLKKELPKGKERLLTARPVKAKAKPVIVEVKEVKVVTDRPVEEITLNGKEIKSPKKTQKIDSRTLAGAIGSGLEENMEEAESEKAKPSGDSEHPDDPDPADIVDHKDKKTPPIKHVKDPYKFDHYAHTSDSSELGLIASGLEGNILQHEKEVESGDYKPSGDSEHPDNPDPADIVDHKDKPTPPIKDGKLEDMIDLKKTKKVDATKGSDDAGKSGRVSSGLDGNIKEYEEEVKKGTYKPSGDSKYPDNPDPADIVDHKDTPTPSVKDVEDPYKIEHFEHTDDPDLEGAIGSGLKANMDQAEEESK